MTETMVTMAATYAAGMLAVVLALRRRVFLAVVCAGCFVALLTPSVVFGGELCKPTRYADGDTFAYTTATGDTRRVRVAGYDAPERSQPFSNQAEKKLRELTQSGADCECHKVDKYGRSVCTVRTLTGENVATAMLRAGFGCIDPRFEKEAAARDREDGREAMGEAQAAKRGMWAQSQVQCGFDYRKRNRN